MVVLTKMKEISVESAELFQTCSNGEILQPILELFLFLVFIDRDSNSN